MKRACVIGWPVEHSLSPVIHGYWLAQHRIDGEYARRPVRPEDVTSFLRNLAGEGYVGCNVTVPHKEAAFAAADLRDRSVLAVGAANTLWLQDGKLCAANTDTYGFMTSLAKAAPLDGSVPMLCALTSVIDCSRQGDCERSTAEGAEVPPFVRVNIPQKVLSSIDGARTSPIANVQRTNGRLMIQGTQNERAWSAVIDEGTGQMMATVNENDGVLVLAAACIAP